MGGIEKLAIAATALSLATAPCCSNNKKNEMRLMADKAALCDGIIGVEIVGRNAQARINLALDASTPRAETVRCVRGIVQENPIIQSRFYPVCTSHTVIEIPTNQSGQMSIALNNTTCLAHR